MNKIVILLISICVIKAYAISLFGITIGDTTTRTIDTLLNIEPLKERVKARFDYESGNLQVVECFIKNDTAGIFVCLKKYFTAMYGVPYTITDIPSDEYCIWKAENCCIELTGQKTDSIITVRIDASGMARFEMLQQMENLYDSIATVRSKKVKRTD